MNALKKMASRARQKSEEIILNAEKTQIGPDLEALFAKTDKTEEHLKKLIHAIEVYMQPNPTIRALDPRKDKSGRKNTLDELGDAMKDAAGAIGIETICGGALVRVAEAEAQMAAAERQLINTISTQMQTSTRSILDNELRTVQKERSLLQKKRLDLDATKGRWKRAASAAQATIEPELRAAQVDFNNQLDTVRSALEALQNAMDKHAEQLVQFVDAQLQYHTACQQCLAGLKRG